MTIIANPPYLCYFDVDGSPLEDGYIYFGAANQNPETNPITVYWDSAYTQPALQPIRTSGGFTYRAGTPANIYVSTDFSITVRDKNRRLVYSKLLSEGQATAEVNLQYSTQAITATAAQTVFGLSTAYTPGNNSLAVYHNGSRLIVGQDYTETTSTSITLAIGATAGDVLQFVTATPINPSSLGAAAVAYVPAGAGAVARTSMSKMADWLSMADFIPDGTNTETADCSPFLQAAINAGGGSVFIPKGKYRMATPIVLPVYGFYALQPGHQIFSQGAQLVVETTTPLFTQNVGTDYTSKWFFHDLSFTSSTPNAKVFDLDRIYNSIFTHNVFVGIPSVFWSRVDRNGDPSYPDGYIQSCYIAFNHFGSCDKGIDAKRAFNLDVSNNYFEGCGTPVAVDGLGDPACSMIRITNNVLEGGGTQIILGGVYGGVIQGNYFENNIGSTTCDIKLNVTGASFHRGLSIIGNQFQPSTAQKADVNWYNIQIAKVISGGRAPVVLGNVTTGPRLINGLSSGNQPLVSGNVDGPGGSIIDQFPIPGQTTVKFGTLFTGLLNNRATAYSAGVWKVFNVDNVLVPTVYNVEGFLNLYNSGGNYVGATWVSFKFRTWIDAQGVVSASMVGTLNLDEITGARDVSGNPLYASYWGAVTPTFTITGTTVTVNFNTFNDYNTPGLGVVVSLGPALSVTANDGRPGFTPVKLSMP